MEPLIAERFASTLSRPDVLVLPYVKDIGALYRSADWFIFPTLEEGGPQVTYEAAGNGVPAIVSPMGAGAFARPGLDGLVIEDEDPEVWTSVIASLAGREEERMLFRRNALERSREFTWEKVGMRRRDQLIDFANHH